MDIEQETRQITKRIESVYRSLCKDCRNSILGENLKITTDTVSACVREFLDAVRDCGNDKHVIWGVSQVRKAVVAVRCKVADMAKYWANNDAANEDLLNFWESMMGIDEHLTDQERNACANLFNQ